MRRTRMMCRLTLAGGAVLLALTGCSGGSNANNAGSTSSAAQTSATSASATTSSSAAVAAAGGGAFCDQARSFAAQVGATVEAQGQQQASFGQKLPALVAQLQAITPPPAIAADWQTAVSALQQMAAAFQGVNVSDPQQLQQLSQKIAPIESQLGTAAQHIENYLTTQCGITAGSTG